MDAQREFKKYDATHGSYCRGKEFSSRVMRFKNIEPRICVQIRIDKRVGTIGIHGCPIYFARILYHTQYGTAKMENYENDRFRSPDAVIRNLEKKIFQNTKYINRVYKERL